MMLSSTSFFFFIALSQVGTVPAERSNVQYSNMYLNPESGDLHGYDLRLTRVGHETRITLFCGEGGLVGPVRIILPSGVRTAFVKSSGEGCSEPHRLILLRNGIRIETAGEPNQYVPRHRNYLAQKEWK